MPKSYNNIRKVVLFSLFLIKTWKNRRGKRCVCHSKKACWQILILCIAKMNFKIFYSVMIGKKDIFLIFMQRFLIYKCFSLLRSLDYWIPFCDLVKLFIVKEYIRLFGLNGLISMILPLLVNYQFVSERIKLLGVYVCLHSVR